jgi:hypothetical protein
VDYEDKCINLNENQCTEEPICYPTPLQDGEKCTSSVDILPFPQLCMPKYEVPNRAACFEKVEETGEERDPNHAGASDEEDRKRMLQDEGLRLLYHQKLTEHTFAGKWSGKDGVFNIPDTSNTYCEFEFITPVDNKKYTLYRVNESGENITLANFTEDVNYNRAKGVFVDLKLREIEKKNNLPQLPFHGYADLKILKDEEKKQNIFLNIDKCITYETTDGETQMIDNNSTNVDILLGVYRYIQKVFIVNEYNKNLDNQNKIYLINRKDEIESTNAKKNILNSYHYRMIDAECNLQLQEKFDRMPKMRFNKVATYESETFDKDKDLKPID